MDLTVTQKHASKIRIALLLTIALLVACGPFFPNELLLQGDDAVMSAPVGDFRLEIARVHPTTAPTFRAVPPDKNSDPLSQSVEVDCGELSTALQSAELTPDELHKTLDEYLAARQAIAEHRRSVVTEREQNDSDAQQTEPHFDAPTVPKNLPGQFSDYLHGLIAHDSGRDDEARKAWQHLLSRPADQRRLRTVWAAFMLGKSYMRSDHDQAVAWFGRTRDLAAQGFSDSLGLASASLGWEARSELQAGRYEQAIELYVQQQASGDPSAAHSLAMAAKTIFDQGPIALKQAAGNTTVRDVLAAYVVTAGGPPQWDGNAAPNRSVTAAWLKAVEQANVTDVRNADRLAWAAYHVNDMDIAARWLDRAPDDSPIANWLRAKLLLRAGRPDEAAEKLALAAHGFPENQRWNEIAYSDDFGEGWSGDYVFPARRVEGELGMIKLSRGQFVESLDHLFRSGYFTDAAYLAERVLTIEELKRYLDTLPKASTKPAPSTQEESGRMPGDPAECLRELLARRLMRAGQYDAARPYLGQANLRYFDQYISALNRAKDQNRDDLARGLAWAEAARVLRHHGDVLVGTELEPDWESLGGSYDCPSASELRSNSSRMRIVAPMPEELRRVQQTPPPRRRWHYRYLAAELAWKGAKLLPDHCDETAQLLFDGGCWLKAHDPAAAEQFYHALVTRCPNNSLGQKAIAAGWFPKVREPNHADD